MGCIKLEPKKKMLNFYLKIFNQAYNKVVKLIGHDGTTHNVELNRVGKNLIGNFFIGVFASDAYPKFDGRESYCIVNLSKTNTNGTHWVARMCKRNTILWCDSFARKISSLIPTSRGEDTSLVASSMDQEVEQMDCGQRCLATLCVGFKFGIGS